jgi:hypothetical protein
MGCRTRSAVSYVPSCGEVAEFDPDPNWLDFGLNLGLEFEKTKVGVCPVLAKDEYKIGTT